MEQDVREKIAKIEIESQKFYSVVPREGQPDKWGIKGGGHTVFPFKSVEREQLEVVAGLMNMAREAALLESVIDPDKVVVVP